MKTALTLMAPRHPGDRLMYLNGALAALDHVRNTVAPGRATIDYNDRRRELLDARQELLDSIRGGAAGPGKTDMVKGGIMSTLAPLRLVFEAMEPSDEEAWEIVGRMSGMANPTGFARSVIRGDTWTVPDLKRRLFLAISNTAPNARSDAYRSPFYHSVLQHFKARLKATDWWLTRPGLTPE